MRKRFCFLVVLFMLSTIIFGQPPASGDFPVRGLSIGIPSRPAIDSFINFMNTELAARKINTVLLRVDYSFQYKSHPELASPHALSLADVKRISDAAKKNN